MPRSMTAYARRQAETPWGQLVWELRSVNHRYLDTQMRLPEELRPLEPAVRERLAARVSRGKVECSLRFSPAAGALALDWAQVGQLLEACGKIARRLPAPAPMSPLEVLRWPGVVRSEPADLEAVGGAAERLLDEALEALVAAREGEGQRLAALLGERLDALDALVEQVAERRPAVNAAVRERLESRLAHLDAPADPGRLEQELAFIAQRLDVDEELERLRGHAAETRRVLATQEPVGRRLDFLMQELNREANTLASKSADGETTHAAVEMKVLIEQMREQVQNLE